MHSLKEFKQLVKTTPLIHIQNAPVKPEISSLFVSLEWRGLDSGTLFGGGVNATNLKDAKFTGVNEIAIRLANLKDGKVTFNNFYTTIKFWHIVEVPVM